MNEVAHKNIQEEATKQLMSQVDSLSSSMDFFRNLYSPSDSKNNVLKIVGNICKHEGIKIPEFTKEVLSQIPNHRIEKSVAVILFLFSKLKKKNLEIEINPTENNISIVLKTSDTDLQKNLLNVIHQISEHSEPSHENILIYYVQKLLSIDGYFFKITNKTDNYFEIIICKKDSTED
jgi:hypothetical protein